MPLYEYRCTRCRCVVAFHRAIEDRYQRPTCPDCREPVVMVLIPSVPGPVWHPSKSNAETV